MNEGVVSDFSNRPFLRHVAWLVTALFVVSPPLHAWQSETAVIGKLIAAGDRTPIEGMLVEIIALRISARSDGDGAFRLVGVSPGTWVLTIQRIGFGQHSQTITVPATPSPFDLGTMTFTASPTQLADVVVEARQRSLRLESAGFYDRQKRGSGSFADRADLEKWSPQTFTDVLRHMRGFIIERNRNYGKPLPPKLSEFGYVVEPSKGTDTRRFIIRTRRGSRGQCPPLVFMDGTQLGSTLDFNINQLNPDVIQGVEAFSGPSQVPAEYNRPGADCGVILVWTR
ncbi:MAG: carboxypeptidase regulatory-like domain-containing protein [Gemmatimonadetes bacterium]|nr:carboxypeptidase regulatory-like domain-containing protein [Gemmatimonadota bacterium]